MHSREIVEELEEMIEEEIHKTGLDGTRYYLLSRDQLEEIIEALK